MGPKNGLDRLVCEAHSDIQEMRTYLEEDLRLSQEMHTLLNSRVTELIATVDRINQTLMKVFFYGMCFIAVSWSIDHFGIDVISKLIGAVKADQ